MVDKMAADNLVMQGVIASTAMTMTQLFQNILASA